MNKEENIKQLLYSNDDNLEVNWISQGKSGFQRTSDSKEAISILLFDLTDGMKINNIYLLNQADYLNGKECSSCLIEDINYKIEDNEFYTNLSLVLKGIRKCAQV